MDQFPAGAISRIAAWAKTRAWPEQNIPLIPKGPWSEFVRRATEHDVMMRVQDMSEVASLLADVETASDFGS